MQRQYFYKLNGQIHKTFVDVSQDPVAQVLRRITRNYQSVVTVPYTHRTDHVQELIVSYFNTASDVFAQQAVFMSYDMDALEHHTPVYLPITDS